MFIFHACVKRKSLLRRIQKGAPEHESRITLIGVAVGILDVAKHSRDAAAILRTPGQYAERCGIGVGEHVALLDTRETLYRGPIEKMPLIKRIFQFFYSDGKTLQETQDVGEPHADETHAEFAGLIDYEFPIFIIKCVRHYELQMSRYFSSKQFSLYRECFVPVSQRRFFVSPEKLQKIQAS